MRSIRRRCAGDEGISTVLLALMLPMILGMQALVVDVPRTFVEQRALQNAADAAALAAAVYLPSTAPAVLAQARQAAIDYAARNGVTISDADVTFSTGQQPNDRVQVHAQADVTFAFARTFGVTLATVARDSAVQVGQLGAMSGVLPLGVEEPEEGTFEFGEAYCLKLGSHGGGAACSGAIQGKFHALDIDDTGNNSANEYRDALEHGSTSEVALGESKSLLSGNMQGPTQQGIGCSSGGRLDGDTSTFAQVVELGDDGRYRVLDWDNPRIVVLPIVHYDDGDGHGHGDDDDDDDEHGSSAQVISFGVFFIDSCGSNGAVIGRFIDTTVPGGTWTPLTGSGSGAYVRRLVG